MMEDKVLDIVEKRPTLLYQLFTIVGALLGFIASYYVNRAAELPELEEEDNGEARD
jgi:demethoxyubiquinone hydroxylase (CLK1/Coq7/Cat5 family)